MENILVQIKDAAVAFGKQMAERRRRSQLANLSVSDLVKEAAFREAMNSSQSAQAEPSRFTNLVHENELAIMRSLNEAQLSDPQRQSTLIDSVVKAERTYSEQ